MATGTEAHPGQEVKLLGKGGTDSTGRVLERQVGETEMGNRRKWAKLQVRAGFEQRQWEEISGAAQGELRGGGRGGVIQLWGVGSPEGNSQGQEKEMMFRPGGCQC